MITDLNLYKVFYVVAKCENISHAAEKLFISQPAVSKSIKTLEKTLNVTLFTRSSKGSFMLLEKENITRKHIDNYFYSIGKVVVPDIEASNMNFLIDCAKMGLGITSVFVDFVKEDLKNGTLIELPINIPIPKRYIGIAYNKNMPLSYAASTLINYLKNL